MDNAETVARVLEAPTSHAQVVAALESLRRTDGPSFADFRRAGVPFATDRAYLEALTLIRTAVPRAAAPTYYVVLHANANLSFGKKVRHLRFTIGEFRGWPVDGPVAALVRADGAFVPLPRFARRHEDYITVSDVTIGRDPRPDRPMTMFIPGDKRRVARPWSVWAEVRSAKALFAPLLADGGWNEVALETAHAERLMFLALFGLYEQYFEQDA